MASTEPEQDIGATPGAPPTIIVTRHPALVTVLRERGIVPEDTPVLAHATPGDVLGKRVVGVLPLYLASLASSIVVVDLALEPEIRGRELNVEAVRQRLQGVTEYVVRDGPPNTDIDRADALARGLLSRDEDSELDHLEDLAQAMASHYLGLLRWVRGEVSR